MGILALSEPNLSSIWITLLTIYGPLKAQMWSFFDFLGKNQISDGYLVHILCKMFKKWTKKLIILALTVQNLSFDKNCRLDFRWVFNQKLVFLGC